MTSLNGLKDFNICPKASMNNIYNATTSHIFLRAMKKNEKNHFSLVTISHVLLSYNEKYSPVLCR